MGKGSNLGIFYSHSYDADKPAVLLVKVFEIDEMYIDDSQEEMNEWIQKRIKYINVYHSEHTPISSGMMITLYYEQRKEYPWDQIDPDQAQQIDNSKAEEITKELTSPTSKDPDQEAGKKRGKTIFSGIFRK